MKTHYWPKLRIAMQHKVRQAFLCHSQITSPKNSHSTVYILETQTEDRHTIRYKQIV